MFDADTDRACCEESYRRGLHDGIRLALAAVLRGAEHADLIRWERQVQHWREERQGGELEYPPFPPQHDGWDPRRPAALVDHDPATGEQLTRSQSLKRFLAGK